MTCAIDRQLAEDRALVGSPGADQINADVPAVWSKQCRSVLPSIATTHDMALARSEGVHLPVTKEFDKRESETEYPPRHAKALNKSEKEREERENNRARLELVRKR